jgi:NAD(P)-dependent dehydrogenase (short-subunit alcohol dehydrogenase family)
MTRSLAVAWGKLNISVNAVAIGTTPTRMTKGVFENRVYSDQLLARVPLGRH